MSGPEGLIDEVRRLVSEALHEEPERGGQLTCYRVVESWGAGLVKLGSDQAGDGETCCVQLGGDVCGDLGSNAVVFLAAKLRDLGMRATRVDVKVDYIAPEGGRVGLLAEAEEGIDRGELCGVREVQWVSKGQGGARRVETIYLGGRTSEKRVRIYDKGVESGTRPAGEFERFETQFRKGAADKALSVLVGALESVGDVAMVCHSLALSAVEFRENDPGTRRSRRRVCDWWAAWCYGVEQIIVRGRRRASSLLGYSTWVARAVMPALRELVDRTGLGLAEVLGAVESLTPAADDRRRSRTMAVAEFTRWWREGLIKGPGRCCVSGC